MKNYILKYVKGYTDNQIGLYSTQAAFYFIVSAVPFLMFLLSLIRFILPMGDSEVIELISSSVPRSLQSYVSYIFNDLYTQTSLSLASVTALTTLWASSRGTFALTQGLNKIHGINSSSATLYIKDRLVSLFNTLLFMATLVFAIIVLIFGGKIKEMLIIYVPKMFAGIIDFLDFKTLFSILIITALFSILYAILPSKNFNFFKQIPGALCATIGWLVFSYCYAFYINNFSSFSITYGILAAAIFMMLWLKICMMIFLVCGLMNTDELNIISFIKSLFSK